MQGAVLERPTLVLNRNWQPVNVATVARSLTMLWNESAHVVDPDDFRLYTWADWARLEPRDGEPFLRTVAFRMRVPEVLTLTQLRPPPRVGRHLQPPQPVQARPHDLPVLRHPPRRPGADDRPRHPEGAGRRLDLGELRPGLRRVQHSQGQPHARAGEDAPQEAPVRPAWKPLYASQGIRIESWWRFLSEAYWNVTLDESA